MNIEGIPKNKRHMREIQQRDSMSPKYHKPGTKPARKAKKFQAEMQRKHSKKDLMHAHQHMMEHMR